MKFKRFFGHMYLAFYFIFSFISAGLMFFLYNYYPVNFFKIFVVLLLCMSAYFIKFLKPHRIDIKQAYIYHLLSAEKLDVVYKDGIVNLRKTKGFFHNISGLGKKFTYFHSNFKGNSYIYNHYLKKETPEYMLIIPTKNLDNDKIYVRYIDKAILYNGDYCGTAKVVRADRFKFINGINIRYIPYIIIDYISSIIFMNIAIQFIVLLIHFFGLL